MRLEHNSDDENRNQRRTDQDVESAVFSLLCFFRFDEEFFTVVVAEFFSDGDGVSAVLTVFVLRQLHRVERRAV